MGRRHGQIVNAPGGQKTTQKHPSPPLVKRDKTASFASAAGNQTTNAVLASAAPQPRSTPPNQAPLGTANAVLPKEDFARVLQPGPEYWLGHSPDITAMPASRLKDEANQIDEWISRQTATTPDVLRLEEVGGQLHSEIARREKRAGAETKKTTRGPRKAAGKPAAPTRDSGRVAVPRALREHSSIATTEPAVLEREYDEIMAYLQRQNVVPEDRKLLQIELANLEPALTQHLTRRSAERHIQVINRALTPDPSVGDDPARLLEAVRRVDSIRPIIGKPGYNYLMHGHEMIVVPDAVADDIRANTLKALDQMASQVADANEEIEADYREFVDRTFEKHQYVGFISMTRSGENPLDWEQTLIPGVGASNQQRGQFRELRRASKDPWRTDRAGFFPMAEKLAAAERISGATRSYLEYKTGLVLAGTAGAVGDLGGLKAAGQVAANIAFTPAGAALYGAGESALEQTSEIAYGQRESYDVKGIAFDAAAGYVGAKVTGGVLSLPGKSAPLWLRGAAFVAADRAGAVATTGTRMGLDRVSGRSGAPASDIARAMANEAVDWKQTLVDFAMVGAGHVARSGAKAPAQPAAKAEARSASPRRSASDNPDFSDVTRELGLEPPTPRTPGEPGPRDPNDPHWDDYQKVLAKRGFENAPGVSQHADLQRQLGEIRRNREPNTQRQNERLDVLRRDVARRQKEIKPLETEVTRLRRQAKSKSTTPAAQAKRAEAQRKLAELEPKLQNARNQRKAVEKFITQTKNRSPAAAHERVRQKLALSRTEDFEPLNRPLKSRGADAGSFQDTHAVVKVVDSKTKRVVAWSIETFNAEEQVPKPENKLQAKKAREAGTDKQKHAEQKSLPNIEYQLRRRGIKSLKGYSVEVVGDREVCERVCQPALQEFAGKKGWDADAVDGYTYHGTTARGRPLSEKKTAVKRSTDLAEGMTVTKQRLPIYRRPEGGPPPTAPSQLTPTAPHRAPIPQKDQDEEHPARGVPRAADDTRAAKPLPQASAQSNVVGEPPRDAPPATKAAKQTSKTIAADSDKVPTTPDAATEPGAEYATPPHPAARKAAAVSSDAGAKAAKQSAKAAVPEHAQPIIRDPGGAPSKTAPKPARPPSSRGEKLTGGLAKTDAVLGAVRDYQQYKADGASDASALARSGTTLAANLKGGPAAAIVNAANAYDNARRSGQGKLEATATAIGTAGGGVIASKVAPAGPVGTAVNLANTAAQALGAPQGVQDATTGAAALVPSNIVATTVTEGARSYANLGTALVTGDTKALDKQVQGFQAGSAGPWLQGYAQVTGMVADMAAGDNFETALNKAAASGKGSWADRVGSKGGDALYELGQSKEAKSGKYGASVQGISMALGITSDMIAGQSFEQALNKAAKAGEGSWPEKVGNALGDAAWDATEKTRQLVNEGLPAAKQAIKDKWNKLWS
ncbi:MAG: hypothetical protein JO320_23240 [Alphaproteobacteria bacterium]|nr:hypothetical protein [Alphaproteobacteria bacterium]